MSISRRTNVLGVGVSALNMGEVVKALLDARAGGKTGYVCVTGVHGVIESQRDPALKEIHNRSLLTVPDGMPTVWMGREQGFVHMGRVYGPDLMLEVCRQTAALHQRTDDGEQRAEVGEQRSEDGGQTRSEAGATRRQRNGNSKLMSDFRPPTSDKKCFTHFLYGSTPEVLEKLKTNLESRFPGLQIVGTYAPPFRPLNDDEEKELRRIVAEHQPDFFWVGLSTPKQERFMYAHRADMSAEDRGQRSEVGCQMTEIGEQQMPAADPRSLISDHCKFPLEAGIMLGVGAAFPIHAGLQKDAPEWIKNSGLQWLHRLCQEPKRLWRRYLYIVPTFLWLATLQMLGIKKYELD